MQCRGHGPQRESGHRVTQIVAIRHGDTDVTGRRFTGRSPGIHLNACGRQQAERLPERLRGIALAAIWVSPLERAQETAAPLAWERSLEIVTREELTELDYGDWQGYAPEELQGDPYWARYNRQRSFCRIPGGESLGEAQLRMSQVLERLTAKYPEASVAIVGHGDPLRAMVAQLLGVGLDFMLRFEIVPASITVIRIGEGEPRVLCINDTGELSYLLA